LNNKTKASRIETSPQNSLQTGKAMLTLRRLPKSQNRIRILIKQIGEPRMPIKAVPPIPFSQVRKYRNILIIFKLFNIDKIIINNFLQVKFFGLAASCNSRIDMLVALITEVLIFL
jgi:hypothetical protein